MHERALRTVLLVQAVEQSDRTGELLPLADRAEATRSAARDDAKLRESLAGTALTPATERFLTQRAERLRERVEMRSPVIRNLLMLSGGASWLGRALCVLAFVLGLSLSTLDGSRRINILAFPLLGLIAWNVVVYILLIANQLRGRTAAAPRSSWLADAYERFVRWRTEALSRRSSQFHAPLANALKRFASEWSAVAHPLLILRAKRLFHLSAALVALGLILGIYVRGIALRYEAGWESTFLGPGQVAWVLKAMYGPASFLSGIPLPQSEAGIEALRWNGVESGGGQAAAWIHLIALTAVLYIVLPRLLAAAASTSALWWHARRLPAPAALLPYVRETLASAGETVHHVASVTPYAYEPEPGSVQGLERLLSAALGGTVAIDLRDPVRYGDEDSYLQRQSRGGSRAASWNVLLMSLASTPEAENHGTLISHMRDASLQSKGAAPLLIAVDEGPFATRMGNDSSLQTRIEERRRLWRDFVAGYGLRAYLIDLPRLTSAEAVDTRAREGLRDALWTGRERAAAS
jgi:hypothetical protein